MPLSIDELRNSGKHPRVHGNGFIQLDLNENGTKRLHVFDESLPRQEVPTPIHDHVFDMRSNVILGTLIHEEISVHQVNDNGGWRIFRAEQEKDSQNTVLIPDKTEVILGIEQHLVLGEGSMYTFPAFHFHQTEHVGLTATIMEKLNSPNNYGRPRVLVPIGSEPDNDFDREGFDPEELWPYIEKVINLTNNS